MALWGTCYCTECGKTYNGDTLSHLPCGACISKKEEAFFDELKKLTIEERIERLERLQKKGHSHFGLIKY